MKRRRIKNIFIAKFFKIGILLILLMLILFIALFKLEVNEKNKAYLANSKQEVDNLQNSILSQMSDIIKWINFYSRSETILSAYEGSESSKTYLYNSFKGWIEHDEILTAVILYDKRGNVVLGHWTEEDREKIRNFITLKNKLIGQTRKGEYRLLNNLNKKRNNTSFIHFVPIYEGEELKGYMAVAGNLKKLLVKYKKNYRMNASKNIIGFLRVAKNDLMEGLILNEESMDLEVFKWGFKRVDGHIENENGDSIVISENVKEAIRRIDPMMQYNVKYEDVESTSASIIIIKRETIISLIRETAFKYLNFYIFSVIIILLIFYRYFKLAFENDLVKRKLRVKARKLDKNILAMSTVVSVVGHDIKGPFTSLLSGFALINQKLERMDKKQLTKYLKIMEEECRKACHFSENLMKWGVSENDFCSYTPREINLHTTTQKQIEEYRGMADLKEIKIKMEISSDLICYSDKEILKTIIRNLIINAIKFTSSKGKIEIKAWEDEEVVKFTIEDSGIGISKDVLEMLERGTIHSSKGTTGELGNGMGLILIKRLCKINMGSIKIKSELGNGTKIKITIPKKTKTVVIKEVIAQ